MRYKAGILLLCVALLGGVVAAAPARAQVDCATQLATDLQNTPPPDDPNTLVTVNGLDIDINTNWSSATTGHLVAAAVRFAQCMDPVSVVECTAGVLGAIREDITSGGSGTDDETYLRYVVLDNEGIHIRGNTASGDAFAIASCL